MREFKNGPKRKYKDNFIWNGKGKLHGRQAVSLGSRSEEEDGEERKPRHLSDAGTEVSDAADKESHGGQGNFRERLRDYRKHIQALPRVQRNLMAALE